MPARVFVFVYAAIELYLGVTGTQAGVAHFAHLGGMLVGLLYLKGRKLVPDLRGHYDRWRRNRLRRKFEVYYNDRHRANDDQERWRRWKN